MSHPFLKSSIGEPFIELSSVDSTNNYAMAKVHAGLATHGTTFFAHHQWAGKGQRGKQWLAAPGANITLSVVIEPFFLSLSQQFLLSSITALSCYDFLTRYIDTVKIKWPNDLYFGDKKAGGILIENIFKGSSWSFAIIGIGININQILFKDQLNAISLKQITDKEYDVKTLSKELLYQLEERFQQLQVIESDILIEEYNKVLYKREEKVKLKKGNVSFETTIKGVSVDGQLLVQDTLPRQFDFGEVEWVI